MQDVLSSPWRHALVPLSLETPWLRSPVPRPGRGPLGAHLGHLNTGAEESWRRPAWWRRPGRTQLSVPRFLFWAPWQLPWFLLFPKPAPRRQLPPPRDSSRTRPAHSILLSWPELLAPKQPQQTHQSRSFTMWRSQRTSFTPAQEPGSNLKTYQFPCHWLAKTPNKWVPLPTFPDPPTLATTTVHPRQYNPNLNTPEPASLSCSLPSLAHPLHHRPTCQPLRKPHHPLLLRTSSRC